MAKRYFEFSEGTSNKFWEVWVEGTKVLTRYGKIGAAGQTTVKDEGSPAGAQKLHDKLVSEKTKKGYEEKGGGGAAAAPPPPAAAPAKKAPAATPPPPPAPKGPVVVEPGFRRFEFVEGGSSKFWEVKVEDEAQTVRFGKIGTAGQEKTKDFDSPSEAKADTKKLIAEKTGKGYVEVGGKPKAAGNPELEAAIEKNLDDASGYLVYADWLQAKGDPLGELIVMQHRAQSTPHNKDFQKSADAHLQKHKEALLGPLAAFPSDGHEKKLEIEWQYGFMKNVDIRWEGFDDGDGGDAAEELAALLDLPAARFLQGLRVGPFPSEDEMSLQPFVDVLEEKKAPTTLRSLYLGNLGDWDISGTFSGKFAPLAKAFPKLEKVTLHAGNHDFGKGVSLPALKELNVETGGLDKGTLKEVLAMNAPNLERLSLWFGDDNYGGDCEVKDLAALFAGGLFPRLKHLGVMNCSFVGDAVKELAKAKLLPRLTSLDLSMGCLNDKDIDFMVSQQAAFKHLQDLNVDDNGLTDASEPKLKGLAKNANFGKEQDPERAKEDHYRYVSVAE